MIKKIQPDLIITNGKIVTMNPNGDITEAVAVIGENIVATGTSEEISELAGNNTKIINAKGKTVTPGFIESHCHPSMAGPIIVFEVDLHAARSIDEIINMVKAKASTLPPGKWIRGMGYDDQRLVEKRHPTCKELDKASTAHPMFLRRTDGHMGVVNSLALKMAKIDRNTPDPDGGRFVRDAKTGEPNGLVQEKAQVEISRLIPSYTAGELKQGILAACAQLAEWGFTSYNDADVHREEISAYQELSLAGELPLRVGMMISGMALVSPEGYLDELIKIGFKARFGSNRLRICGAKFFCDGSMSGLTAALNEPYANNPEERGIIVVSEEELTEKIVKAHKAGLRPLVHAIGDRAIDVVLNAVEKALTERPDNNHRIRIEHCTMPSDAAIERIKRLGVIPSASVGFIPELGPAHLAGLGENRMKNYFPMKTFLEKDMLAVGNSDWPVTVASVAKQLYGVVTRKGYNGEVIGGSQAIGIMDAIKLYTINAAYATFEEDTKGSIEVGKLADFTVLEQDVLTIPDDEIIDMKIAMTIVGGKIVYQR